MKSNKSLVFEMCKHGVTSVVLKVIEDGQVKIIMPDGRKLNMQGAEVK